MPYKLRRLAPGSYDLLLDGRIVGSVVEAVLPGGGFRGWSAELLDEDASAPKPEPFTQIEHSFVTLSALQRWLGGAQIVYPPQSNREGR